MNDPTRRAKLPKADWSLHKGTIIQLYLDKDLSLKDLAQRLATDHGFHATTSQLEFQLKSWRVRKNLKSHEWKPVLAKLDRAPLGTQTRVCISGRVVPKHRIDRARLHCQKRAIRPLSRLDNTALNEILNDGQVCIQMQKPDGTWVADPDVTGGSPPFPDTDDAQHHSIAMPIQTLQELARPSVDDFFCDLAGFGDASRINEPSSSSPIQPTENISTLSQVSTTRLTSHTSLPQPSTQPFFDGSDNVSFGWEEDEAFRFSSIFLDSQIELTMSLDEADASSAWQLSLPDAFNYVRSNGGYAGSSMLRPPTEWEWLARLPFQQFENTWKTVNQREFDVFEEGLALSNNLGIWCFVEEISNTDPTRWHGEPPLSHPTLLRLIRMGMSYLPEHGTSARIDRIPDNDQTLVTGEEMSNTNLFRLIIYSMINGLASLGKVPIESIVEFLDRFQNMNLLVSQFLRLSERHTTKAFVESLLLPAVRQNRVSAVVEILATKLLDDTTKLRFLGEAVHYRKLEVSKVILDAILGSAKSKNGNLIHSDRVRCLLRDVMEFPLEWTPFVQRLLDAGVTLTLEDLTYVSHSNINLLCRTELCCSIASTMDHSQHAKYVGAHWFFFVATTLHEVAAIELIQQFISFCHEMHGSKCIRQCQRQFDWGVVEAAKRGCYDLVRLQLPLCRSLSRVFSAAIRSGNVNLINLVMDQQPDINKVHCIEHYGGIDNRVKQYILTSALAEALRTRNAQLTRILEFSGVLDHLSGMRFKAAIRAAAEIKDYSYFKKLIQHGSIGKKERGRALLLSIENSWDAISTELLDTDTQVDDDILYVAVKQRKGPIVQKILNAGINSPGSWRTLRRAIKWGDRSLITQLLSIFVYPIRFSTLRGGVDMISCTLENIKESPSSLPPLVFAKYAGGNDVFDFLLGTKLATREALNGCLKCALFKNDRDFIRLLIDQGADPLDSDVLEFAVKSCPNMLHLLLTRETQNKTIITRGLRTKVLKQAVRVGHNASFIGTLIDSGLIDIFDTGDTDRGFRSKMNPLLNPLGEAISLGNKNSRLSIEIIMLLLKAGHNPNDIVEWGFVDSYIPNVNQTALLKSIETMDRGIVQALLDRGAKVNEPAVFAIKRTPLQKASEIGSLELVQLLISRGADVNGEPAFQGGGTALQMAAISGNCNVAAKLLSAGALLYMPPSKIDGRWPLEGAAEHGRLDMVEFLWKANQEIVYCGGKTGFEKEHCIVAMKLAKKNGHSGCKDLIEKLSGFKLSQARLDMTSDSEEGYLSEDEEISEYESTDETSSISSED
ncbi:hypothetical protein F4806DRAFT_472521 [Annulohypoxylon nitens]|nr:hypothetical protein F4806DRAFT_472521 [Annulohypoxylon nitens]